MMNQYWICRDALTLRRGSISKRALRTALFLVTAACAIAQPATVRVGSKAFTEGVILGEIVSQAMTRAGFTADHRKSLGGTQILWKALQRGEIDAYVEYTGTISEEILRGGVSSDTTALVAALAKEGVAIAAVLGFNNTYAIGMSDARSRELGITSISDLRDHRELRIGFSNEFLDRRDGWPGLRDAYGLPFTNPRGLDHDLAYRALADDQIDLVDLYSTDAEIEYYNLRVLVDDRNYFPRYEAVVLVRTELSKTLPGAVAAIGSLAHRIDAKLMIAMNAAAKLRKLPEADVARQFLNTSDGRVQNVRVVGAEESVADSIAARTQEHITLVGLSLLASILVGVPLGILSSRVKWIGQLVLALTSIVYTIPSLALLVVMIPVLGIGTIPVLVALFLYSLLPIVRNTYTGLAGISPPLIESAVALGLSPSSRLVRIEMPLAMPTLLAGIKTAAVMNVATATIGALIGAGGYGQPILTGIRLDDMGLIMQGAIPAAALALIVQGALDLLERLVVSRGLRITAKDALGSQERARS